MTYSQIINAENHDPPAYHFQTWNVGSCTKCRYVFSTKADKDRHILIIHNGKRAYDRENADINQAQNDDPPAQFSCQICQAFFPTRYFLRQHMNQTGHTARRGRPRVNP